VSSRSAASAHLVPACGPAGSRFPDTIHYLHSPPDPIFESLYQRKSGVNSMCHSFLVSLLPVVVDFGLCHRRHIESSPFYSRLRATTCATVIIRHSWQSLAFALFDSAQHTRKLLKSDSRASAAPCRTFCIQVLHHPSLHILHLLPAIPAPHRSQAQQPKSLRYAIPYILPKPSQLPSTRLPLL
jgi:hypothetical protein